MANTKSAIKRIRRISKQTAVNKARKSRYKNALKKMNVLIESKVLNNLLSLNLVIDTAPSIYKVYALS